MTVPTPYLEGFLAAAAPPPPEGPSFEEGVKRRLHPLDAFTRLLDGAAANRPPDAEDRFRFQWFGLFYQAPAQDAFTLRLRLPGGRLKPFQLDGLAEITQSSAGGQLVLNAHGGLDVPGVPIPAAGRILSEVEGIGLSARRTGGDCVRAVRGGEEGDAPVYPLVCALEQALAHGPVFADLPRPCEIVFQTRAGVPVRADPIDTLVLQPVAAPGPDGATSFLLGLPGDAENGYLFPHDRVVPDCLALLRAWASGADRSSRENASLARFVAGLDPAALGTLLEGAKRTPLPPGGPPVQAGPPPGLAVPKSRLLSGQLNALARGCREQEWREIRWTRGGLCAVGMSGEVVEAATALTQALSV